MLFYLISRILACFGFVLGYCVLCGSIVFRWYCVGLATCVMDLLRGLLVMGFVGMV